MDMKSKLYLSLLNLCLFATFPVIANEESTIVTIDDPAVYKAAMMKMAINPHEEERIILHILDATDKNINPVVLAIQNNDLEMAELLLTIRRIETSLGIETFSFPGYKFSKPFGKLGEEAVFWMKRVPVTIINSSQEERYVSEARVDVEVLKLLTKYDNEHLWSSEIKAIFSHAYQHCDLTGVLFCLNLSAGNPQMEIKFSIPRLAYLLDPFLSDFPINFDDSSHFYNGYDNPKSMPYIWECKPEDNEYVKEIKRQIQVIVSEAHLLDDDKIDYKTEIETIRQELEKLTIQSQEESNEFKKKLEAYKTEINTLREELKWLEAQGVQKSEEFARKFDEFKTEIFALRREIKEFENLKEHQRILVKYENNSEHLTPFHCAIKNGDNHSAEIMLQYEVNIDLLDGGYTPLHRAIEANHIETAALLIQNGANVNAYDGEGYTPLHKAIVGNQFEMVNFLLQHGADSKNTVQKGLAEFRCLDLARQYGNQDLVMLFLDKDTIILEEKLRQLLIEANLKNAKPIALAFQKYDLGLAEYLLQTRERDLVLKNTTFEFPGYQFCRTDGHNICTKHTPVKIKGVNGVYVDKLHRVDCEVIKILIKYDSQNQWKNNIVNWLSQSYHNGDLESIAILYPIAKQASISIGFKNEEQRYLIDPFLSDITIDRENPSHFYIPGKRRPIPPSIFEYRSDDNARIKELKGKIQGFINSNL